MILLNKQERVIRKYTYSSKLNKKPEFQLSKFFFFTNIRCRVIFTGTVVVIPDILALASPGDRAECRREATQRKNPTAGPEGVKGLRSLGVRDLSYRLAFIANSVQVRGS